MKLVLYGFMGVGKTSIGRVLAEKLNVEFIDLDEVIVERTGIPISRIFEVYGEARFREIEKEITKEMAEKNKKVIACGGGTILDSENKRYLSHNARMVLLTAEPTVILDRVERQGGKRPLLMVDDKLAHIKELLAQRHDEYVGAADVIVDTSEGTPQYLAEKIIEAIEEYRLR
ncbi:MAG: shikimate kinase [Candidatus Bathyarchaeia archaeon]